VVDANLCRDVDRAPATDYVVTEQPRRGVQEPRLVCHDQDPRQHIWRGKRRELNSGQTLRQHGRELSRSSPSRNSIVTFPQPVQEISESYVAERHYRAIRLPTWLGCRSEVQITARRSALAWRSASSGPSVASGPCAAAIGFRAAGPNGQRPALGQRGRLPAGCRAQPASGR
jgi:hypothetical protein